MNSLLKKVKNKFYLFKIKNLNKVHKKNYYKKKLNKHLIKKI